MKKALITGLPGVGKTTLIKKLAAQLESLQPVGFYTAEIRENRIRKGFELVSFNGRRQILSHVELGGRFRVGKYGVDVRGFDRLLDTLSFSNPEHRVVIIDEIGKMECYSDKFKGLLEGVLNSDKILVATIALKGGGIISEIKRRPDVRLFEITAANRDDVISEVLAHVKGK